MILTILQARTNSTRLPAKALLPVNNLPMSILAAERAKNNFSKMIVATSNEKSDDLLCKYFKEYEIEYFRGSLENVISRFVSIADSYKLNSGDTIIRLTGDNPVVDKYLLEDMLEVWTKNNFTYMQAQPDNLLNSNWPKGLSAEFFTYDSLIESFNNSDSPKVREHVTTDIKLAAPRYVYGENINVDFKTKSCSVDTFEDYLHILDLFENHSSFEKYTNILKKN
tara:strand:- start:2851 stop:3522 length:672 start_codon:yes stop_codon:yes gene_type:complete